MQKEIYENGILISSEPLAPVAKSPAFQLHEITTLYRSAPVEARVAFASLAAQVEMFLRREDPEAALALVQAATVPEGLTPLKLSILQILQEQ